MSLEQESELDAVASEDGEFSGSLLGRDDVEGR